MMNLFKKLAGFALTLTIATQAEAQMRYYSYYNIANDGNAVTEIKTGQDYVMTSGSHATTTFYYLAGTGRSATSRSNTVYQFEAAGQAKDGSPTYRLKQMSTGLYLETPVLSGGTVTMTPSAARAFEFTAKQSVGFAEKYADTENPDPTIYTWLAGKEHMAGTFVFCNVNWEADTYKWFSGYQTELPTWTQYIDANLWYVYEVEPASGYDNLNYALADIAPNGIETIKGMFSPGELPGNTSLAAYDNLLLAYSTVEALAKDDSQSDEVYNQAIDDLLAAIEAARKAVIPIKAGYYVIDNNPEAGRPSYAGTTNACLYEKGGYLYWNGFNKPEVMTPADASYIWEVIPAEDGGWYLRNFGTGRYAGAMNEIYNKVPSTADASQIYDIVHRNKSYFSLDMRGQNSTYPALHADQNKDMKIVIWNTSATASQWSFIPVPESELENITSELEQNRRNEAGEQLLGQVKADYIKGFTYASDATPDGLYQDDNLGLVTSSDKFFTNAQEPSEGLLTDNVLLDNNQTTYFHTVWSVDGYADMIHNICADLSDEYLAIAIKYSRRNSGASGAPKYVRVYTTNDTLNEPWKEQAYIELTYPYQANETYTPNPTLANFTGIASVAFDAPYRYVRFDVEHTMDDAKSGKGTLYFNFSELRIYEATYDKNASLIEAVPKEIVDNLKALMDKMETEIAAGTVAQQTIDDLTAAHELFLDNYPDPQIVINLLKEADAQAEAAEEGDELGYFKAGAKTNLQNALDAIRGSVKPVMTVSEVKAAKEAINAALAAFNAQLIVPENGQYFYIKCATETGTEDGADNKYLYAQNNDESNVKYALPDDMSDRLHYIWKFIKHEDGSYSFMNCGTGTYMGNPKQNNVATNMSLDADSVTLRSAKIPGIFNIVCTENVFMNAQPGSGKLVTWGNANGHDNSAFIFENADEMALWDGSSVHFDLANSKPRVISLPYEIYGEAAGGVMYKVLGIKDNLLQLQAYSGDEMLPAATPFILVPDEAEEGVTPYAQFYLNVASLDDIAYDQEGKNQNGLQATLQANSNVSGGGILFNGSVINATESDASTANSGFFSTMPAETTEDGDYTMAFPESIETAIEDITVKKQARGGIYTLSGVKVRNNGDTNGLPKGIYIVNGNKLLVK